MIWKKYDGSIVAIALWNRDAKHNRLLIHILHLGSTALTGLWNQRFNFQSVFSLLYDKIKRQGEG